MSLTGLTYVHDFISDDDAANLLSDIDGQPWLTDLKRRTQHYGYKYDYTKKSVDSSLFLGALPEWIQKVANRLVETKHFPVILFLLVKRMNSIQRLSKDKEESH